jgi:acyl carrier protein
METNKRTEVFEKVKSFLIEKTFITDIQYTSKTNIEEELGVTGDDAVELIIEFGNKFNVDVSKFMLADYFRAEGIDFLGLFKKKKVRKILTLGDLVNSVITGRLDEKTLQK